MIIELESIIREPRPVRITFRSGDIDLESDSAALVSDVEFTGEALNIDDKAHLRGEIKTQVSVECTRCLEAVEKPVEVRFDDTFISDKDEPLTDEVEAHDLDESIAIDGRIDVAEVVREQLILALPEQEFCKPDCRGLCPQCGENRNLIDCSCEDDEIDPRWAALKNLN